MNRRGDRLFEVAPAILPFLVTFNGTIADYTFLEPEDSASFNDYILQQFSAAGKGFVSCAKSLGLYSLHKCNIRFGWELVFQEIGTNAVAKFLGSNGFVSMLCTLQLFPESYELQGFGCTMMMMLLNIFHKLGENSSIPEGKLRLFYKQQFERELLELDALNVFLDLLTSSDLISVIAPCLSVVTQLLRFLPSKLVPLFVGRKIKLRKRYGTREYGSGFRGLTMKYICPDHCSIEDTSSFVDCIVGTGLSVVFSVSELYKENFLIKMAVHDLVLVCIENPIEIKGFGFSVKKIISEVLGTFPVCYVAYGNVLDTTYCLPRFQHRISMNRSKLSFQMLREFFYMREPWYIIRFLYDDMQQCLATAKCVTEATGLSINHQLTIASSRRQNKSINTCDNNIDSNSRNQVDPRKNLLAPIVATGSTLNIPSWKKNRSAQRNAKEALRSCCMLIFKLLLNPTCKSSFAHSLVAHKNFKSLLGQSLDVFQSSEVAMEDKTFYEFGNAAIAELDKFVLAVDLTRLNPMEPQQRSMLMNPRAVNNSNRLRPQLSLVAPKRFAAHPIDEESTNYDTVSSFDYNIQPCKCRIDTSNFFGETTRLSRSYSF